ncbi:uncharacterized protein TNCV_3281311 [Trichonephila clavipes]|nr:uncharacterized protein TNCV_3281311 [Trichonephila clavipes]
MILVIVSCFSSGRVLTLKVRITGKKYRYILADQVYPMMQTLFSAGDGIFQESNAQSRDEVDIPLQRFRRQYEQLSHFERGRIIGMMDAGWSARQVARQLGHSDCVVRRDQWIQAQEALDRAIIEKTTTS